jgi:predicted lactoylglutathione lyase
VITLSSIKIFAIVKKNGRSGSGKLGGWAMAKMVASEARKAGATEFGGVTPILKVGDLAASMEYYVKVLGFKVDWINPGVMGSVSRGRCHLMLCEGDQGNPGTWVWIGVEAIEQLFEEYSAKGAKVRTPPTNYAWAYEMQIEDPDGHVLRFGADAKKDQPIGDWLDQRGQIWVRTAEGGWRKKEE